MTYKESVWIFQGVGAKFPCGVYSTRENAEILIRKNRLSGILTKYPLDVFIYDWAITNNYFKPKKPSEGSIEFKQKFTSGSQEHYHYEDGELD